MNELTMPIDAWGVVMAEAHYVLVLLCIISAATLYLLVVLQIGLWKARREDRILDAQQRLGRGEDPFLW